jgi:hypothetical protein
LSSEIVIAALLAAALPGSAATAQALAAPIERHGDSQADTRLKRLFDQSDEAYLKRNPLEAVFRGDLRYADRPWTYLSRPISGTNGRLPRMIWLRWLQSIALS